MKAEMVTASPKALRGKPEFQVADTSFASLSTSIKPIPEATDRLANA
jgi:hypothetical protein